VDEQRVQPDEAFDPPGDPLGDPPPDPGQDLVSPPPSPGPGLGAIPGLRDHPLRHALTHEVHARPPAILRPPLRGSQLAMLSGEDAAAAERAQLERLCDWAGASRPPAGTNHAHIRMGSFEIRWERHTEFSTWTILRPGRFGAPFGESVLAALPAGWLAGLPGELMVGIHFAVLAADQPLPDPGELTAIFGSSQYVGSAVLGGAGIAWTDFRIHGDGFSRILLADRSMTPAQTGRVLQRLLEIETYRVLALLALPLARSVLPRVGEIERALSELTSSFGGMRTVEEEALALDRLTQLAARAERIASETSYRFGAARAYWRLVQRRIADLRETRLGALQTFAEFMERRLLPAMDTCEAVEARLEVLSQHIFRASGLLRTRVEVALERTNADLLRSMDRRAAIQLRLQETVEALSVVAISYYAIGIVEHALRALEANGLLGVATDRALIAIMPLVLGFVAVGLLRLRRALRAGNAEKV
jgi:uncharacterized membrane-anchored protein